MKPLDDEIDEDVTDNVKASRNASQEGEEVSERNLQVKMYTCIWVDDLFKKKGHILGTQVTLYFT